MENNRKNKKYYMIFLSYILIMIIPLITGGMLHIYNRRLANRQSEAMAEKMLLGIQQEVDGRMDHVWQLTALAAKSIAVSQVLNHELYPVTDIQYQYYLLGRELEKMLLMTDDLKDLFVYFKEDEKIVSVQGVMDVKMYSRLFLHEDQTGEALQEILKPFQYKEIVKMTGEKGEDLLYCIMSDPSSFMGDPSYSVVAVMEGSHMKQMLDTVRWEKESTVFIQDKHGQVICSVGEKEAASQLADVSDTEGSYNQVKLSGELYSVMARDSGKMDWSYYIAVPQAVIEKNAHLMQRFYMIALFGCIFVGFAIASVLTSKNYHPIKILTELLTQYKAQNGVKSPDQGEDEYQWLKKQTERFFMERLNTIKMLNDNRRELKNYYLLKLLENSYTEGLDKELEKNQILFPHEFYVAVQFLPALKGDGKMQEEERVLQQFILKNIFAELTDAYYSVYMVLAGERIMAIINFPGPKQEQMERICGFIQQAQEIIEEKFSYEITALVGGCYCRRAEIVKSYSDTCEAENYISLLEDNLICYDEIKDREKKYWYSAQLDQMLFQAVKSGDGRNAKTIVTEVLEQHGSGKISLGVYRCLMFDLLGTILKAADDAGYHKAAEEYDITEKLSVKVPMEQTRQLFELFIDHICGRIQELKKDGGQDKGLSKKIQEYIRENYKNPDLNVSITSQHFHLSPSYLSTIYKKQTGSSILEYINHLRLEEAERLLAQGLSVVEVAGQAGFRDSAYLIRVFKKKRGVTPGQAKKLL